MGSEDPDFAHPDEEGRRIVAALPPGLGRLAMVAKGGHYPHAQLPAEVAALVVPFLDAHSAKEATGN